MQIMKQTKLDKAMRLMTGDYVLMSEHSNMFLMMTKKQETDWENAQIAQYMQMPEGFLDYELQRRQKLTKEQLSDEALHWMITGSRVDAKELAVGYMEWAHIPYDKKKLSRL